MTYTNGIVNKEKLKIYNYFEGDIDSWARRGSKKQKEAMNDDDWFLIESLIQDIKLVKNNLASPEFSKQLTLKLRERCDNEETIQELLKIVK